jgi:hypothetical protein
MEVGEGHLDLVLSGTLDVEGDLAVLGELDEDAVLEPAQALVALGEEVSAAAGRVDQKYPKWYNGKKNGFAWCDMFVDWCFLTAFGYEKALALLCQPEKSAGAGCTYSLRYFKTRASSIPRTRSREIKSSSALRSTTARTPASWSPWTRSRCIPSKAIPAIKWPAGTTA